MAAAEDDLDLLELVQRERGGGPGEAAMAGMGALPTGTVTFLFTDIEGSTRRWEQQTAAMGPALARHDTLVRAAVEGHGGCVFETAGDGFCAVIPERRSERGGAPA